MTKDGHTGLYKGIKGAKNGNYITKHIEFFNLNYFKKELTGTFLVAQWLRICLPMQGTQV